MALGGLLVNKLIAKFTAPLEELSLTAEKMGKGDLALRLANKADDEYAVIAYAFNNLSAGLTDKLAEIEKEKRKLELILDNMDNAVAIVKDNGVIADCNKRFIKLFGMILRRCRLCMKNKQNLFLMHLMNWQPLLPQYGAFQKHC